MIYSSEPFDKEGRSLGEITLAAASAATEATATTIIAISRFGVTRSAVPRQNR